MKIIGMPLFAILVLAALPYLVACSSQTQSPVAVGNNYGAALAQSNQKESAAAGKDRGSGKNSQEVSKASGAVATGKVIELPHYPPDFPPGPGKELFISRCGVCHSLRYITMQPDFPKKTWAKEVDKMIKTFGAHIDKKEADEIIEYLNSIKGKPTESH